MRTGKQAIGSMEAKNQDRSRGNHGMPWRLLFVAVSTAARAALLCLIAVAWCFGSTARAGLRTVTADDVSSYDLGVNGGVIHVVYETAGTIQHKQSTQGSGTWSAATPLGSGSNPSLTFTTGGIPMVSLVDAGSVVIATRQAGVWSTANLGNPNGTTRAMIRTDGAGTTHLLVDGSGTGGRGSIDYASFNGSSWSAFINLAYGWYDSGSGNYCHQPVLGASAEGGGYTYAYESDNWGGRASWSEKYMTTSGVTPATSHAYGWNSSLRIADGGYLASSSSLTMVGYSIDGTAYVQSLVGGAWSTATLGAGTNVAVHTAGALFESGTAIKTWDGTSVSDLLLDSNAVQGHLVRVGTNDTSIIAYLTNGTNQLMLESVILAVPPAISSQPVSVTINSGATATFTVAASGTSPSFQWYEGISGDTTNPISAATGTSFTTPALIATTSYWVRASNAYGTADSDTVTATVITPPAISSQPVSVTINSGATATFTVAASGTSPSFQWYEGISGVTTNPIPSATGTSFTSPALSTTTSYWVRASNAAGTADSNTVTATVITPPAIVSQPVSTTINSGSTATFTVTTSGTSPTFQWYEGDTGITSIPIDGANESSFTTPVLIATTNYWVRASNAAGTADSNTVTVTVITPPTIVSQPVSTTINTDTAATFTVTTSGTSPTFQWYEGISGVIINPIPGATGTSFTTPALSTTTSYWVRASNAAGTADSNTVTATVATPPAISSQPVSVTINSGETTTLTVSASGTSPSFQWYEGMSGDIINPILGATESSFTTPALSASTSYWVRASNAAGTADSNTVTVSIASFVLTTTGTHGSIAGAGSYDGMTHATVSATADPGYVFSGWTGDASGVENPLSLLMNAAKAIEAIFSPDTTDSDGDGLSNYQEIVVLATNPNLTDSDGNGVSDALEDPDHDGLSNLAELKLYDTNPLLADSNSDGFADAYSVCFEGTPYQLRIGNQIAFDLSKLITTGQTLKLSGKLPSGLKFNATTGLLSGTLSGKAGTYQASVQVLQGKTVVRTIPFPITVLEFPATLIGKFDFLMEDADSFPNGVCKITITGANKWSATLESAGASKKRSAKGSFILAKGSPIAPIIATFPAIKATSSVAGVPAVIVNIPIDGSTPTITGTYDGGTLRGFRLAKVGEMPPATVAYSLVLDAGEQNGITVPAGLGWMKGKVSNKGIGTFKGLLGDGTSASITLGLSAFGQAVLWSQPYKKKTSYIGGIVTLGNLGQTTPGESQPTDEVLWKKAEDLTTLSYPNGFAGMSVTIGTSRWIAPATATALGQSLGWRDNRKTKVIIDGGGFSNEAPQATTAALPTEFSLDDKFNLITSAPGTTPLVVWKGKAVKTDGSFTGTLTLPTGFAIDVPGGTASASGVLVQDEWGTVTGCGLVKVPTSGPKGSFKTAAMILNQ